MLVGGAGSWQHECCCYARTSCQFEANFCNVAAGAALASVSLNRYRAFNLLDAQHPAAVAGKMQKCCGSDVLPHQVSKHQHPPPSFHLPMAGEVMWS